MAEYTDNLKKKIIKKMNKSDLFQIICDASAELYNKIGKEKVHIATTSRDDTLDIDIIITKHKEE